MKIVVPYVRVITAPPVEPVALDDAKTWCRVDGTDQDAVITMLIQAARERAEEITGRAFVQRTLELRLDQFPDGAGNQIIELPYAPLIGVSSVIYLDSNGALQTLSGSPSNWIEDTGSEPGRIQPLDAQSWPATQTAIGAVRIRYEAGYAPASGSPTDYRANIPALVKQWMQVRISTFYEQREALITGGTLNVPPRDYVDGLLDGLKINLGFA